MRKGGAAADDQRWLSVFLNQQLFNSY